MTTDQLDLFAAPATRGASRRSDPQTSRDAGRSMEGQTLRDQQALVLSAVAAIAKPYNGSRASAFDVSGWVRVTGGEIQQNVAAKRIGELVSLGMLRETGATRPGSSGRPCRCFALTPEGRHYLEERAG